MVPPFGRQHAPLRGACQHATACGLRFQHASFGGFQHFSFSPPLCRWRRRRVSAGPLPPEWVPPAPRLSGRGCRRRLRRGRRRLLWRAPAPGCRRRSRRRNRRGRGCRSRAAWDPSRPWSFYLGGLELLQFLLVGLADLLEGLQGGVRLGFVELGHGEAHVDEDPVPDLYLLVLVVHQPDVYVPLDPTHARFGQEQVFVDDLNYPTRYPQTHASNTPFPWRACPPVPPVLERARH